MLIPFKPLNVPLMQSILRGVALTPLDSEWTIEKRESFLQIAEELPYWSLTQEVMHLNPARAQFMLTRLLVLFSGLAALHGMDKLLSISNDAEMSDYLTRLAKKLVADSPPWMPVSQSLPRRGEYVLIRGPSGMVTTPEYCRIARYDPEYRPRDPWVTEQNSCLSDYGEQPTHWRHLGSLLDPTPV